MGEGFQGVGGFAKGKATPCQELNIDELLTSVPARVCVILGFRTQTSHTILPVRGGKPCRRDPKAHLATLCTYLVL